MAEDFNHIDQIIRQKFENFEPEPPMQVWDNIRSGINKNPPPPSSTGFLLPIIVTISLLIFLSGLINHFYIGNSTSTKAESSSRSIHSASLISTGSTTSSDLSLQQDFYQTPPAMPAEKLDLAASIETPQEIIPVRAPFEQNLAGDRKKKSGKKNQSVEEKNTSRPAQWKPGLVQALKAGELSYGDAAKYDLSVRDVKKLSTFRAVNKTKLADWSIGVFFNPEMTHYQDNSLDNTLSYSLGIMPRLSFNRFFIQSGINMRYTHDKGNYAVDYNRFLGTYEDVYLVTFDTVNNVIVPTYYTHTVEVYDTISHYSVSETQASYTYLEIPMFLGYRYNFGKFSVFGKAGPAASFLALKNVPEAGYPEDKAKIINVDYQVPARSVVNWQLMMGAGFDYQLADKFSFSLEPTFRFALKPEYKPNAGVKGNSTSFGIRAGLNYNF
jgi:hypothetical protein